MCCATTSSDPVFDSEWVRPGTHVNGIGAFRLGMVELPPELFARAALVAVDSRERCGRGGRRRRGRRSSAASSASKTLVEIGSISLGWAATRDHQAITAFKSVGLAIQDVAAAELVVARVLGDRAGFPA